MAISEAARSDLYTGLRDVLGRERAETLMSAIPLHDLEEVATKGDLALLRGDVAGVRAELKTDIAELKTDIADLRAELKTDIADLRAEIHREFGAIRKTFTTWMLTLSVAIIAAMASIVLTS